MKLSECPGHWALITGASAGIGREFASQIASLGWNVALVARREDLEALSRDLTTRYRVEAVAIRMDLSEAGAASRLRKQLEGRGIRIRLLCNNAAAGHMGHFEDRSTEEHMRLIQLNVVSLVAACREFYDQLTSFPTSAIINVSSQAAYQPVPYMATYAASKAFVHSFSQALFQEWQASGITVQTLVPGPTATEFDSTATNYDIKITARGEPGEVVRRSLEALASTRPIATNARGLLKQRILAAIVPPRMLLREVAKLFGPPDSGARKRT